MYSKTSMLYWWPKVNELHIPIPKTEIVEVPYRHLVAMLDGKRLPRQYEKAVIDAAGSIGFPLFLRTDMSSAKHSWERTCFVSGIHDLLRHIWTLIDETLAAGMFGELDPNALVFRELLDLDSAFIAFSGLPISRERRYFARDGIVECHHAYWIQDAIEKSWKLPSNEDWRQLLGVINEETPDEEGMLGPYSSSITKVLGGYWSVDFACSREGQWYLLDMAEGEKSWHPEHNISTTNV